MKKYGKLSASIVLCTFLAVLLIGVKKGVAEDTVIHAGQSGDLTWEIQQYTDIVSKTRLVITGKGDYKFSVDEAGFEYLPWQRYGEDVDEAVIRDVKDISSLQNCFYGMEHMKKVTFSNVDTSKVTDMSGMFQRCRNLETIDWGGITTENVTDMSCMFSDCDGYFVNSFDLSSFDTRNVTNMSGMFQDCGHLTELDLRSFNTAKVTDMSGMFGGVGASWYDDQEKWVTLDISSFDTSKVINMSAMFENTAVKELDLSNFDTASVVDMSGMFYVCASQMLDLQSFNTSKVTDMSRMFDGCASQMLDLQSFNTSKVTNMSNMFDGMNITSLKLSSFDTSSVSKMGEMFAHCKKLEELDISSFDTSSVTDMNSMFYECCSLKQLNLSSFDTHNVLSMNLMFYGCESISELDLSSFDLSGLSKENLYGGSNAPNFSKMISLKKIHSPKVVPKETSFNRAENGFYRSDTGEMCVYLPETNGQSILLVTEDLLDATLRPDPDKPIESMTPDPIESISTSPTAKPTSSASAVPSPEESAVPSPGESEAPSSTASAIPTEAASAIPSVQPTIKVDYYMEGSFTGWGGEEAYPSSKGHAQDSGDPNFYYADRTNIVVGKGYNCGLELMNPYNDLFTGAENEMSEFIQNMKTPAIRVTLENGGTASAWNWHTELSIPSGEEVILTKEYLESGYFALFGNDDTITKVEFYDKGEISEPSPSPSVEPTTKPTAKPTTEPAEKPTQEPTASAPSSVDTEPPATQTPAPEKSGSPNETPMPTASAAPTKPVYRVNVDGDEYAPSKPAKVKIKKASPLKSGKVKLTWKKVSRTYVYKVQYSTKRSFRGAKVREAYGTKINLRLKKNKTYYIRVRSCKYGNSANNFRMVKGNWSKVKKVKTKA